MSTRVRRLYQQFQPETYNLELTIDPEAMHFSGRVIVTGKKIGRPSQRITLHQNGLKISTATIIRHDKRGEQTFGVKRINAQQSFNEVRLHTEQLLYPGIYTVEVKFSGPITQHMEGIYPCYFKHDGQDKKLIATQFESHHAREAFPCIDEPEAKATFDLTLVTPIGLTVVANTPTKAQKTMDNKQKSVFETTQRMSTYLLAFVVGEMHCVEGASTRGVTVRSWATVAQPKTHLEYANREAIALLDFFEDYFQTPFPLPKVDQVALPDFDALAMENWGLITFREVGLLADPENRSLSGEQLITLVIAHELSHQWFGNLVTMRWWDDLWLNESFASVMETLAPDKLHPEWQAWEDFTARRIVAAAERDVYKDVQPIGLRVNHPDEIATLFDPAIVYAKGARVLKMLLDFIGEDAFRQGLALYFKSHAYQNTTRNDLWQAFSDASGLDISSLMTPWIEQSGTPELTVAAQEAGLELEQRRFLLDGDDRDSLWPIPLLADQPLEPRVLSKLSENIPIPNDTAPIFNPNGSGHFITNYKDAVTKQKLYGHVKARTISSNGRIIALSDMLQLAKHGEQALIEILDLVKACAAEDRDAVWSMFARVLKYVQILTDGNEAIETCLNQLRLELSADWHAKLGWADHKNDDPNTKHLRTTMLSLQLIGEDKQVIDTALKTFIATKNVGALPAEQRAVIASTAVRFGKPEVIKKLMSEYETSTSAETKDAIAAALCSTRDPAVAERIVAWGMRNDQIIKPQDIDHFFAYMMRNRHIRDIAWQWLNDYWPHLVELFGSGKKMEYFIWHASRPLSSADWLKRYSAFFEPKLDDMSLKRNILISLAEIEVRVQAREREEVALEAYLRQHASSTKSVTKKSSPETSTADN